MGRKITARDGTVFDSSKAKSHFYYTRPDGVPDDAVIVTEFENGKETKRRYDVRRVYSGWYPPHYRDELMNMADNGASDDEVVARAAVLHQETFGGVRAAQPQARKPFEIPRPVSVKPVVAPDPEPVQRVETPTATRPNAVRVAVPKLVNLDAIVDLVKSQLVEIGPEPYYGLKIKPKPVTMFRFVDGGLRVAKATEAEVETYDLVPSGASYYFPADATPDDVRPLLEARVTSALPHEEAVSDA